MYKKAWRKVVVLIIESIGFVFFFFYGLVAVRVFES